MRIGMLTGVFVLLAGTASWAADDLPRAQHVGKLEVVATFDGPMPTGVTVSRGGRIFVNFPRWGDAVEYTVAEVKDRKTVAYPNAEINRFTTGDPAAERFVSVQSVVIDPNDRLWVLDTGRIEWGPPVAGGPKLIGIDLQTNAAFKKIPLPPEVALPTTYLNDVRFELRRGPGGLAFITDSSNNGPSGLIVVDLASGRSWRKLSGHASVQPEKNFLPIVEGRPLVSRPANGSPAYMTVGADGIALSPDGRTLWYCPLSGRGLFSVKVDALADEKLPDEEVAKAVTAYGARGFASDGLEMDGQGRLYLTNYEDGAIVRRGGDGAYETIVFDDRVLWPDTLCAAGGHLYFTANQLHRQKGFHAGQDLRTRPYVLFRVPLD